MQLSLSFLLAAVSLCSVSLNVIYNTLIGMSLNNFTTYLVPFPIYDECGPLDLCCCGPVSVFSFGGLDFT
jgi:hypothetical protein